jgi:hypothetical protein
MSIGQTIKHIGTILLITLAVAAQAQTYEVAGCEFLNMREGPASTYPINQRLQSGVNGIVLIGKPVFNGATKWQQVNSRGVIGWVNAYYLRKSVVSPPARPPSPTVAQSKQPAPKDYFTLSSTMDEVASLMGTPSSVSNFLNDVWWYYGYSRVVFRQGRVIEWDNISNNLKVRWSSSTAPPSPPAGYSPSPHRFPPTVLGDGGGGLYLSTGGGHWIKTRSDDGDIITLEDGSVWLIDPLDRIDTALWLPITDITVVESEGDHLLVNTDDGEKAHARLLHQ